MTNITELSLSSNIFSLGSILGTTGSQELIQQINASCGGGSFFGNANDPFHDRFQNFMTQVIEPIRMVGQQLYTTAQQVFNQDVYRPIDSVEELKKGIPPCMQLGVLHFAPVRQMLDEERIDGFGIDPKTLRADDPYERLLKSGKAEIHSTLVDEKGGFQVTEYFDTDAPDLTIEEKIALDVTRKFLAQFVEDEETKVYDPTDYPSLHC